jgi:hypothetical protein
MSDGVNPDDGSIIGTFIDDTVVFLSVRPDESYPLSRVQFPPLALPLLYAFHKKFLYCRLRPLPESARLLF